MPPPIHINPLDEITPTNNLLPSIDWDAWAELGRILLTSIIEGVVAVSNFAYRTGYFASSLAQGMVHALEQTLVTQWANALARIRLPDQRFIPAFANNVGVLVPVVPIIPMNLDQAYAYILSIPSNDPLIRGVISLTQQDALALTNRLGGPDRVVEISGGGGIGYFWHYHPQNAPHTHIWYF
jgi:hypothetical protein